ncbi:MAG: hypothetical protein LBP31_03110 [Holosporales bacterium]|nr:hypothetical protein [Holosporales bacterium]
MKFEEDQKAQNEKIEAQNKKIEVQNKEIENLKSLVKGLSGELEGTKRKDDNKEASFVGSKDFNDLKIQFENLSKQLGNLALKVSSFIDKKEKNKDE